MGSNPTDFIFRVCERACWRHYDMSGYDSLLPSAVVRGEGRAPKGWSNLLSSHVNKWSSG